MQNTPTISKKIVILGDSGVGKTSILVRYVFDRFEQGSLPTLGASFKTKIVDINQDNASVKLNLWDTAG